MWILFVRGCMYVANKLTQVLRGGVEHVCAAEDDSSATLLIPTMHCRGLFVRETTHNEHHDLPGAVKQVRQDRGHASLVRTDDPQQKHEHERSVSCGFCQVREIDVFEFTMAKSLSMRAHACESVIHYERGTRIDKLPPAFCPANIGARWTHFQHLSCPNKRTGHLRQRRRSLYDARS